MHTRNSTRAAREIEDPDKRKSYVQEKGQTKMIENTNKAAGSLNDYKNIDYVFQEN